jgi:DNA-binding MarR family transcriptional regulator
MSSDFSELPEAVLAVQAALRALSTEIDRLDGLAADRFGLNRTDLRALDLIASAGSLAPTALARGLGYTTGGVTTVIDRLEAAGYVRREPDPADRRRLVLRPTDAVAARESEVFADLIRETQALIATYPVAELATIRDFLERTREATARDADRLAAMAASSEPPADRPSAAP